jgi:hypothetical protein
MNNLWADWRQASCLPDCWCEAARHGHWILEPINTWTNLAFIFAGIYIFWVRNKNNSENLLTQTTFFSSVYATALVILGAGSFFFHMSQTFWGQWFDVIGMYLVAVYFIFYNFHRLKLIDKAKFLIGYIVSVSVLGYVIYAFPQTRRYLFGVIAIAALIQTIVTQKKMASTINKKLLFSALGIFAIGQTTWILDKQKVWCDPHASWMNGHGVWHICCGITTVLVFLYFKSENFKKI